VLLPGSPNSPYQEFAGNGLTLNFKGQTEIIAYFDAQQEPDIDLTGTWTETLVHAPDAADSWLLLGIAVGGLGMFRVFRRGEWLEGNSPFKKQETR